MENKGQIVDETGSPHPEVLFVANAKGYKVFLDSAGLHYQFRVQLPNKSSDPGRSDMGPLGLSEDDSEGSTYMVHQLDFLPLDRYSSWEIEGLHPLAYRENYYNLPTQPDGIEDVRSFEAIRIRDLYPGIDWLLYWREGRLKYDWVIHPGADPNEITIQIKGAESMELDPSGNLVMKTPLGTLTDEAPSASQVGNPVGVGYTLSGDLLHYRLDRYDTTQLVTIDPGIAWASYYGGSYAEEALGIAVSDSGLIAMVGSTRSPNMISYGNFPSTLAGNDDGYILLVDSNGTPLWGTYVGGVMPDHLYGVVFDHLGGVVACGGTESQTGIATTGCLQPTLNGPADVVLMRFGLNGALIWGTYFGGPQADGAARLTVDLTNAIYVAGKAGGSIPLLPIGGGFQQSYAGGASDAFIAKFTLGGALTWGTLYGGPGGEASDGVVIDGVGNIYLGGATTSASGIAYQGFQGSLAGNVDGFLVKFSASGNRRFATYYGGTEEDQPLDLAIDSHANAYLTGWTRSTSGITYNGYQMTTPVVQGLWTAFLIKFDSSGGRTWGTYYIGSIPSFGLLYSDGLSVSLDDSDGLYWVGRIRALDGMADHGFQMSAGGTDDGFVAKFDTNCNRIWGSFWGGGSLEYCTRVASYKGDWIAVASRTGSQNLAVNGFQPTHQGSYQDAFVMKIDLHCDSPPVALCRNATVSLNGSQATVPVSLIDSSSYSTCNHFSQKALIPSVFSCGQVGLQPILLTITDGNGTDTCQATVLVQDVTPPTIICPSNVTTMVGFGQCSTVVNYSIPVGTDYCGLTSISLVSGPASGSNFPVGITNIVYQATDSSGNTSTCTFAVTVGDYYGPTITCPSSTTICTGNYTYPMPVGTDNCPGLSISLVNGPNVGGYFPVGNTAVTWRVTDASGNSTMCTFYVYAVPQPQPVNLNYTICHGASLQIGNHTYNASGSYSDTLVSYRGCDSVVNTNLIVLPPIDTMVMVNLPTLSAQLAGAVYQWLDCDQNWLPIPGANGQSYTPSGSGNYAVEIRVAACKDSSSCRNVTLTEMLGPVNDFVDVYPNPTAGTIAVRFKTTPEWSEVRLFECTGKLLEEYHLTSSEVFKMDLSHYSKGIYLLQVDASTGSVFIRVERW